MPVVELDEFKAYVNVTRAEKNALLQSVLNAAIAFGGTYTRRQLELIGVTEVRRRVSGSRFIRVPDARTVTGVELDGIQLAGVGEGFELLGSPGSSPTTTTVEIFARGRNAKVTGTFGMTAVPNDLRDAIIAIAARRYWERETGNSESAASDEYGAASYFRAMPGEVRVVLDSYRVPSDHLGLA